MNEEFLHYIWQQKLYLAQDLKTTANETIEVLHPGHKNSDSGPDFFNAKIRINGTLWAGNVEIHQSENDWQKHRHHTDPAYDNVILHVVNKVCNGTFNSKNNNIPVYQLKYGKGLFDKYFELIHNEAKIPCQDSISHVDAFIFNQWIERMLIEKLQEKHELIKKLLHNTNNDWDQVFFVLLARSFGFSTNGQAFETLARQTPLKILLKHSDNIFQVEAILFGQAGFLNNVNETNNYISKLFKEYFFLKNKYKLKPIDQHNWKYLRLRPSNFPTIRISQLAILIHLTKGRFSDLLNLKQTKHFKEMVLSASEYWNTHYTFNNSTSKNSIKKMGLQSKKKILFNTILPYIFVYASYHKQDHAKEKIIDLFYSLPPETNRLLSNWKKIGLQINNEAQAQALIFLKNHYCNHKKCLNCHIGHNVLSKSEK